MANMRAVRIHEFGGSEVLKLEQQPVPEPAEREVLVKIHAASVNPVDHKTRAGKFPMVKREQLPVTLGRDLSGVVERCGKAVTRWKPGDEVFALLDAEHGAFAEYVAVAAELCAAKPISVDHVQAAALPLAALTAWQGLFDHGRLESGQKVLIHGGAGGVGHLAIQLARFKGARVATTIASGDMEFASDLDADEALDYKSQRFEERLKDFDLVLDLIGGETQARSWRVLKRGGALISTVETPSQERARELGARASLSLTVPSASQLAEIAGAVDAGRLHPHVASTFSLEQAAAALQHVATSHTRGKVVLRVE